MSKIAGNAAIKVGTAGAAVAAFPIAHTFDPDEQHPYLYNFVLSVGMGAAFGAAAGVFFPGIAGARAVRLDAIREGAMKGGLGAPIIAGAAMLLASRFLRDLLPFEAGRYLPTSDPLRAQAPHRRARDPECPDPADAAVRPVDSRSLEGVTTPAPAAAARI